MLFYTYKILDISPDAMETIAAELQKAGYHAYIPLVTGHGIPRGSCNPAVRPGAKCVNNEGSEGLPQRRQGFIDFTQWSINMLREEMRLFATPNVRAPQFNVGAMGLSQGGALSYAATFLGNGLFNKTLVVNPFFISGAAPLDDEVQFCQQSKDTAGCLDKLVENMFQVEQLGSNLANGIPAGEGGFQKSIARFFKGLTSSAFSIASNFIEKTMGGLMRNHYVGLMNFLFNAALEMEDKPLLNNLSFLDSPFGWGENCIANKARSGYCTFTVRNLLALNAFGVWSLARSNKIRNTQMAIMATKMDGLINNSVLYSSVGVLASSSLNNKVSMCMYPSDPVCPVNTLTAKGAECGVPHSSFSLSENLNRPPFTMRWEKDLYSNIIGFFDGTRQVVGGSNSFPPRDFNVCGAMKLGDHKLYPNDLTDAKLIVDDAFKRFRA
jgi:hypothetical protein